MLWPLGVGCWQVGDSFPLPELCSSPRLRVAVRTLPSAPRRRGDGGRGRQGLVGVRGTRRGAWTRPMDRRLTWPWELDYSDAF